jgi:hypothetical protein
MDQISALHIQVYMIVTQGNVLTIQKILYKIKQLGYIVLKMKFETSNFSILGWW